MIWVTWRQNRTGLIVVLAMIAAMVVAVLLAATVGENSDGSWQFGRLCSRWNDVGPCRRDTALTVATVFALLLPPLAGLFVGVPAFSREIEQRTHVVGLTQSASRLRWYLTRVLVVFSPITLGMAVLGVLLWWAETSGRTSRPIGPAGQFSLFPFSLYDFPYFETTGIALAGYTLVALLTGSTMAILLRSTIRAMATASLAFLCIPVALTWFVRDDYATPRIDIQPINGLARESQSYSNPYSSADTTWIVAAGYADADGRWIDPDFAPCFDNLSTGSNRTPDETDEQYSARRQLLWSANAAAVDDCLRAQGVDRYQRHVHTEDDYWRFQLTETGLMLAVASGLTLAGAWGVRRLTAAS